MQAPIQSKLVSAPNEIVLHICSQLDWPSNLHLSSACRAFRDLLLAEVVGNMTIAVDPSKENGLPLSTCGNSMAGHVRRIQARPWKMTRSVYLSQRFSELLHGFVNLESVHLHNVDFTSICSDNHNKAPFLELSKGLCRVSSLAVTGHATKLFPTTLITNCSILRTLELELPSPVHEGFTSPERWILNPGAPRGMPAEVTLSTKKHVLEIELLAKLLMKERNASGFSFLSNARRIVLSYPERKAVFDEPQITSLHHTNGSYYLYQNTDLANRHSLSQWMGFIIKQAEKTLEELDLRVLKTVPGESYYSIPRQDLDTISNLRILKVSVSAGCGYLGRVPGKPVDPWLFDLLCGLECSWQSLEKVIIEYRIFLTNGIASEAGVLGTLELGLYLLFARFLGQAEHQLSSLELIDITIKFYADSDFSLTCPSAEKIPKSTIFPQNMGRWRVAARIHRAI